MKATAAMKATSMKMTTTFIILVPFVNKLRAAGRKLQRHDPAAGRA
jgi:hypothetical protein